MADFSADSIVGQDLVAAKDLTAYNGGLPPNNTGTFIVKSGADAGIVYSYVHDDSGNIWWEFMDPNGNPYYIQHDPNGFHYQNLVDAGAQTVDQQTAAAAEAKKLQDMGPVAYYAQLWGGNILKYGIGTIIVVTVIKSAFKSRKQNE